MRVLIDVAFGLERARLREAAVVARRPVVAMAAAVGEPDAVAVRAHNGHGSNGRTSLVVVIGAARRTPVGRPHQALRNRLSLPSLAGHDTLAPRLLLASHPVRLILPLRAILGVWGDRQRRFMWSTAYSMGRPSRHLGTWGSPVGPGRLRSGEEVAQTPCGGQIQTAYVRKTRAGRLRWFIVGVVCLGCGRFWRDIQPSLGFSYPEGHALHDNRSQ